MLNPRNLKVIIKKGLKQNILVYDLKAPVGVITTKLFLLMEKVCWENYHLGLDQYYIGCDINLELHKVIYGDFIYTWPELNKDGELMKYFEKCGGTLANDDEYLIIGTGEGVCLLGSF